MQKIDRRRYEMLARVRDFGATHGHRLPEASLAGQAFATVTAAIAEIETQDVAETAATVAARATHKERARRALEERLLLLTRTAQVLPEADTEFTSQFALPGPGHDQRLLAMARRCVQAAAPLAAAFVAHGMPPAFLAELGALIDNFDSALREREIHRDRRLAARAGIRQALATALTAVGQLDVIVANHLAPADVVREVWTRNRRIGRPPRARTAPVGDAGTGPAPEPQPAADPAAA